MTKKNDTFIVRGQIKESLPNTMFRITLENGNEAIATLKGKVRRSYVRILPGDWVRIEMTPYDDKRGRIVGKENR